MQISRKQVPNILTVCRLIMIPFMLGFFVTGHIRTAGIIFTIAACTDALDGYLARRWNAYSDFGRRVDPLADRLLVNTAIILLLWKEIVPMWALLLFARDIILLIGFIIFRRVVEVRVNYWGKAATACIMLSLCLLMIFGWGLPLFDAGIVLALVAFVDYSRTWSNLLLGLGKRLARPFLIGPLRRFR